MASTLTVDKIKGGSSGVALTLPTTDGSAGQLLKTDGSAVLSWATDVDTGITSVAADTTPQLGGDLDCNGAQIQWSKGADVVSATALPVLTDGNYFDVTGTTTVTSINTTGGAGTLIKLHFDAILILTHHATDLILPGGANITTAAGDEAEFVEYASGDYRCTSYTKADGRALIAPTNNAITSTAQEWTSQQNFNATTLTFDATQDWDLTTNQVCKLTLTANTTFDAPTNQVDGSVYVITIIQDGTGSRTAGWNTVFKWAGGTAPTLTTDASAKDVFTFVSDGTNMNNVAQVLDVK